MATKEIGLLAGLMKVVPTVLMLVGIGIQIGTTQAKLNEISKDSDAKIEAVKVLLEKHIITEAGDSKLRELQTEAIIKDIKTSYEQMNKVQEKVEFFLEDRVREPEKKKVVIKKKPRRMGYLNEMPLAPDEERIN